MSMQQSHRIDNSFRNIFLALRYAGVYYLGTVLTFLVIYLCIGYASWELGNYLFGRPFSSDIPTYLFLYLGALILTLVVLSYVLLRVFVLRPQEDLGKVEINASNYPEIYSLLRAAIDEATIRLGAKPFDVIYVTPFVSAYVFETYIPTRRRYLTIGWPLLTTLTSQQLKAVVSHELAHFDNNASFLVLALYRTRISIYESINTLQWWEDVGEKAKNNANSCSKALFFPINAVIWYSSIVTNIVIRVYIWWLIPFLDRFNRQLRNVSHAAEYYCDRMSGLKYGRNAIVNSLYMQVIAEEALKLAFQTNRFVIEQRQNCFPHYHIHFAGVRKTLTYEDFNKRMPVTDTHPSLMERASHLADILDIPDLSQPLISQNDSFEDLERKLTSFLLQGNNTKHRTIL